MIILMPFLPPKKLPAGIFGGGASKTPCNFLNLIVINNPLSETLPRSEGFETYPYDLFFRRLDLSETLPRSEGFETERSDGPPVFGMVFRRKPCPALRGLRHPPNSL